MASYLRNGKRGFHGSGSGWILGSGSAFSILQSTPEYSRCTLEYRYGVTVCVVVLLCFWLTRPWLRSAGPRGYERYDSRIKYAGRAAVQTRGHYEAGHYSGRLQ